jgi:hypothetical protein
LLLEAVLRHTLDNNPDKTMLPQVIALVREFLEKLNVETGRTENRFNLLELDGQLVFEPGEQVVSPSLLGHDDHRSHSFQNLRLKEDGRELIHKGPLSQRVTGPATDTGNLQVYLFNHALLMVKQQKKHEQYKVYRRVEPFFLPLSLS